MLNNLIYTSQFSSLRGITFSSKWTSSLVVKYIKGSQRESKNYLLSFRWDTYIFLNQTSGDIKSILFEYLSINNYFNLNLKI